MVAMIPMLVSQPKQQIRFSNFNHLPNSPTQEVFCITKDHLGFIWIGSTDGLYKLDATNTIQVFKKNQPFIEGGIASSSIRALYTDSKNNLWIGTIGGGLTKYHQPTNQWTTYKSIPNNDTSISNNDILSILEDSKGRIWVGTEYGLNLFQPASNNFLRFLPDDKDASSLSARAITSILEDHQQRIWVSLWEGGVWKIYQDKKNRYWIATVGGGFFLMQLPKGATTSTTSQDWTPDFSQFTNDSTINLFSDIIFDLKEDTAGDMWIATANGLNRIPIDTLLKVEATPRFEQHFSNINNQRSINSEKILHIYQDDQDLLWFGTINGISQYSWYANQFENYFLFDNIEDNKKLLSIQAYQQNIWIGTNSQGLLTMDRESGKITSHHFGLLENKIPSLYLSKQEELYVGTTKGIQKINPLTLEYKTYPLPSKILNKNSHFVVSKMIKDNKDRLWIGTVNGLFQLDEQTGVYTAYYHDPYNPNTISDNTVQDIYEDSKGNLWMATFKGLNKIKLYKSGKLFFKRYRQENSVPNSIISNSITTIKEINNRLFIGSQRGLCEYDYDNDYFIDLNTDYNRYNISSIEESKDHQLWGSTINKIFHYDIENNSFRFYDSQEDLGGVTYIPNASTVDDQGYLYFAGNTGTTKFLPSQIIKNTQAAPIVITNVKTINPQQTKISSDPYLQAIQLNHDDHHLTIGFAIQNFIDSKQNQYAYMLDGFDPSWNYTSTNLSATYTNLPHGDYTFKVKASNNDQVWNEEVLALPLTKRSAFWETYWFRGGILLFIVLFGGIGVAIYTRTVRDRNKALSEFNENLNQEIVERKKVEEKLHRREQFMDQLVQERTQQLEIKNIEVHSLLQKIQDRNGELEETVAQRTKELKDYNEELKRSNYDLEQFAYIASHDLQAPLRTIQSFSQLLEKSLTDKLTNREQDFLNFITSGVSNMQELVDSLLTFSRLNSRKAKFISINISHLLEQIRLEINSVIAEKNAQLYIEPLPFFIVGDRIKLKQLFQNLITNAVKFTKPGTTPIVKIQCKETPTHWQFEVVDNGIGIEPEFQEKVFQLFQRLHSKDQYEGTGIGLALCKKIVEQHKGQISIQSEGGKGSRFIFTIDRRLEVEQEELLLEKV